MINTDSQNIDQHAVEVADGRLERITKDDGQQYFRLPEQADPLERGDISLAYGDLLPIQQLARMDHLFPGVRSPQLINGYTEYVQHSNGVKYRFLDGSRR